MSEEEEIETIEYDAIIGEIDRILRGKRKRIVTGDGKIIKETVGQYYTANCGHLIHESSEIGGRCSIEGCNSIVCKDCARICQRCMKLLCPRHQKLHDGEVFCPRCQIIVMLLWRPTSGRVNKNEPSRSTRWSLYDLLFKG